MQIDVIDISNDECWQYNIEDSIIPRVGDKVKVKSNYNGIIEEHTVIGIEHFYDRHIDEDLDEHIVNICVV